MFEHAESESMLSPSQELPEVDMLIDFGDEGLCEASPSATASSVVGGSNIHADLLSLENPLPLDMETGDAPITEPLVPIPAIGTESSPRQLKEQTKMDPFLKLSDMAKNSAENIPSKRGITFREDTKNQMTTVNTDSKETLNSIQVRSKEAQQIRNSKPLLRPMPIKQDEHDGGSRSSPTF